MRRRKHNHGAHENHERWLLTYADMITLLVAFFILLYAMSVMSKQKFEQLALSVRSGFDGNTKMQAMALTPGTGIAMSNAIISPQHVTRPDLRIQGGEKFKDQQTEREQQEDAAAEQQSMDAVRDKINQEARAHGIQGLLAVTENERGLVIRIMTDKLLFAKGDGRLREQSSWILDGVAHAVDAIPNDITVEGHTDDLPIHTPLYPSNWELSTARATSVLRYLVERDGVPAARICASGYAYTRPLLPNSTEDNRSRNRRVDIVILRRGVNSLGGQAARIY